MKRMSFAGLYFGSAVLGLLLASGCGGSGDSAPQAKSETGSTAGADPAEIRTAEAPVSPVAGDMTNDPAGPGQAGTANGQIVQASAQKEADEDDVFAVGDDETDDVKPGSHEFLLREMARLRTAPLDVVKQPIAGQPGKFEEKTLTEEQAVEELKRRCHLIVEKAMVIVVGTTNDPEKEKLFNNAVHFLCDARMKLALAGEAGQTELLNQDAEALFKRNKESFAAAEAGYRLVQLAQAQAEASGKQDAQLATVLSRQARLFAERFPKEVNRAPMALITAGRYCELFGAPAEAKNCYEVVEAKFAQTPFADQVAGCLRRIRLPGQTLTEFGGPTLDGGFVKLEDYAGKPMLIVFWSKDSETFNRDLPRILAADAKYTKSGLAIIGVNLDREELPLEQYLEKTGISWRQIFHTAASSRGIRNPVAVHYGVTSVPTYWLIDGQGRVLAAPLPIDQLEAGIEYSLKPKK
jgi:peroxiredoxin